MLACLSYADKIIECYDFENKRWIFLAERPGASCPYGSEIVYVGGKLYTVGGVQSKDVHSYDANTGDWKQEASLRQFRVAHSTVTDHKTKVLLLVLALFSLSDY